MMVEIRKEPRSRNNMWFLVFIDNEYHDCARTFKAAQKTLNSCTDNVINWYTKANKTTYKGEAKLYDNFTPFF